MKQSTLKLTVAAILTCSVFSSTSYAQDRDGIIRVVTSAVPFMRISPDARAGGMGDVGIATTGDANSSFWNLAKTPFSESKSGVGVTYTPWLKDLGLNDVFLASVAGYYKLDETQALSGSLRYFSMGSIQFTDNLGNNLNTFRPREFAFDAGYSRKLSTKLGLGVGLRYIHSNLAGGQAINGVSYKPGSAVSGDVSLFYNGKAENGAGWSHGVVLSNLGTKISYTGDARRKDYIPANLGLGTTYTKVFDENNKLTFGLDLNKLMVPTPPADGADSATVDKYRSQSVASSWFKSFGDAPDGFKEELREWQLSLGAEYVYNNQFAFRAGYFWEDKLKGNRKYFTMGVGLKYQVFGLNFSYLVPSGSGNNRNPLSNTLRFSLLFDLDGSKTAGN
jgi:Type IX secretion system protein PorV